MEITKLTLCIDFDGVIHSYSKGWQDGSIYDAPVPGALDFIKEALKHFKVVIYSTRASTQSGQLDILNYLIDHKFPSNTLEITDKKPIAFLTIDDRAILFTGKFPSIQEIIDFKTWNASS